MGLSDSLRATWEHRRDLGGLWWRFLAKLGLSKDRFHEWKPWQQRAGKVALAGVLAFLLSMFVNTLEHFFGTTGGSILTFDLSAYVVFAVIALIVIPEWGALPDLELRVVVPMAAVAAVAAAAIVGFATDSTRNAVIAGVGTFIALCAPPWLSRRGTERTPVQERKMPVGRKVVPLIVIALAITYPFYVGKLFTIPVFGPAPSVDTGVNMIVFMMMAVGLNIVVGYAGLLDLGYVAFYAIGAYTAAWFASLQFPTITFHLGAVGIDKNLPGIHITDLGAAGRRGIPHRDDRRPDRPPDPAAARRLPRDRHARLRRDHAPDRPQRERPLQHGLQPDRRPAGDHADRLAGLRQQARPRDAAASCRRTS